MENQEKKFYFWSFQISKKIIFNVEYYILGDNKNPYFSTSAGKFNQPKTDYEQVGQAQAELLPKFSTAMNFWNKWNKKHLNDLTLEEYQEVLNDVEVLKNCYNYIEKEQTSRHQNGISFYNSKILSMQELPNSKRKAKRCEI